MKSSVLHPDWLPQVALPPAVYALRQQHAGYLAQRGRLQALLQHLAVSHEVARTEYRDAVRVAVRLGDGMPKPPAELSDEVCRVQVEVAREELAAVDRRLLRLVETAVRAAASDQVAALADDTNVPWDFRSEPPPGGPRNRDQWLEQARRLRELVGRLTPADGVLEQARRDLGLMAEPAAVVA